MEQIKLVAHRGYQKLFPENTLISMTEAIRAGAFFIETDVQLSADQTPVLYHDRTMERLSDVSGAIHNYTSEQLSSIPLFEPRRFSDTYIDQKILPLEGLVNLLKAYPDVSAFVEVKRCTIDFHGIDLVYHRVSEVLQPIRNRCILMSFSLPFMQYARSAGWRLTGLVLAHGNDAFQPDIKALAPEFIFCDYDSKPSVSIDYKSEIPEWVFYEIDQAEVALRLNRQGVNYIETFDYVGLKSSLEPQGAI